MIPPDELYCSGRLASSGQDCSMEQMLEKHVSYIIYIHVIHLFITHACHWVHVVWMTEGSKHIDAKEHQRIM